MTKTLCNSQLEFMPAGSCRLTSVRCDLEPHGPDTWHRGPQGSRWKSTDASLMCQVRIEDDESGGLLSYTCFRPTPCDVPGHADLQPQGLDEERTNDMGGNAHSTEVKVETEDATTTVSTPDEASTESTSEENTSASDDSSADDSESKDSE